MTMLTAVEHAMKAPVWDCRMCGQCVLHSTGMTCPMTCPKTLRNGPCGGVRENGHCEVDPTMECIWTKAERRRHTVLIPRSWEREFSHLRPPVDNTLRGTSSWVNLVTGRDRRTPGGWQDGPTATAGTDPAPSLIEVDEVADLDQGFHARQALT